MASISHTDPGTRIHFFGIGAQKSGTTSLNAYLRDHPQIALAPGEPHFFDRTEFPCAAEDLVAYHKRFPTAKDPEEKPRIPGEITPIYLFWPPCLERIRAYNSAAKLIVLLRNPMARAYSHWAMETKRSRETMPFSEAIRTEEYRLNSTVQKHHVIYSYAARGFYHRQLQRLLTLFPRQQLHVAKAEDLFKTPEQVMTKIQNFLGVEARPLHQRHHQMAGSYTEPMLMSDWTFLHDKFIVDIEALEDMLGWDCSTWKQPWDGMRPG